MSIFKWNNEHQATFTAILSTSIVLSTKYLLSSKCPHLAKVTAQITPWF